MREIVAFILIILTFSSCDCMQVATGVVLDRQTMKPVSLVSLGKYEKEDTVNSFTRREYTDDNGKFEYSSISGGFRKCPDVVLYFNKRGYKTSKMTFASFSTNDTVFLDRAPFNRASSYQISLFEFNKQIDICINALKEKSLNEISD